MLQGLARMGAVLGALALQVCLAFVPANAAQHDDEVFVGLLAGESKLSPDRVNGYVDTTYEDSVSTWRLFAGARINSFLTAEIGYIDFGTSGESGAGANSASARANIFSIIADVDASERVSFFASAGLIRWHMDAVIDYTGGGFSGSRSGSGFGEVFGLGGDFRFFPHVAVRLAIERYFEIGKDMPVDVGFSADVSADKISVVSLGAYYIF